MTTTRPCVASARIRIDNDAGEVEVSGWDRDILEVVATRHAPDAAGLERMVVEVSPSAQGWRVAYTSDGALLNAWVDFRIRCPLEAAIDVRNAAGEVLISGFRGASRAATASGAIRAAGLSGTATLTSGAGSIEGAAIEGTVHARTSSGRVSLHGQLVGSHRVETASGDIVVDGVNGSVDARSVSGSIVVEGRLTSPSALRTVSGNITARLLPGSSLTAGSLPAETTSGTVDVRDVE